MKPGRRSSPRSVRSFRRAPGRNPARLERIPGRAKKRASRPVDLETLLHFSQQLYAHALTLQELVWNGGNVTYEALKPRYDRQAAQQFEIFYQSFEALPAFRQPRRAAS